MLQATPEVPPPGAFRPAAAFTSPVMTSESKIRANVERRRAVGVGQRLTLRLALYPAAFGQQHQGLRQRVIDAHRELLVEREQIGVRGLIERVSVIEDAAPVVNAQFDRSEFIRDLPQVAARGARLARGWAPVESSPIEQCGRAETLGVVVVPDDLQVLQIELREEIRARAGVAVRSGRGSCGGQVILLLRKGRSRQV